MSALVNTTGEITETLTEDQARRLTERIRIAATNYTEAKAKILALVDEAKAGQAHVALGYASWTAYLSDVLSDEPLRLARDERRELGGRLADEGMSNVAIGKVLGVHDTTVARDIESRRTTSANAEVAGAATRVTEGRDGRVRTTITAGQTKAAPTISDSEADLINAITAVLRPLTAKNVATLTPKARQRLIRVLETTLDTLKGEDQ